MGIESGKYRAIAVAPAEMGRAGTGAKQIAVSFKVLGGLHAGATVPWRGFFSERTLDTTLRSLAYCGARGLTDLEGVMRNEVEIVVAVEPDLSGEARARVRWVNPVGGGVPMRNRMTAEEVRAFAATLGAGENVPNAVAVAASSEESIESQTEAPDLPF